MPIESKTGYTFALALRIQGHLFLLHSLLGEFLAIPTVVKMGAREDWHRALGGSGLCNQTTFISDYPESQGALV